MEQHNMQNRNMNGNGNDYLDFEVKIDPGQGREYPVHVIKSPAGEATGTLRFPFDDLELENHLQALQIALLRSGGKRRRLPSPGEQKVQDFGAVLFDTLLCGEIRNRYDVSLMKASHEGKGVRLKLRFQAPGLAALPWEFLFDKRQGKYLCLSRQTPIVRYVELPHPVQPLAVGLPLRVLAMVASPCDLPSLDVDREKQRIEKAIASMKTAGLIELTWLEGQSWRDLMKAMRGGPWHVFHFIGHGSFDAERDEGLICLADEDGKMHLMPATHLSQVLSNHSPLRLVLLNACEGGRGSQLDIFSSSASILVQQGIPAVLAMQYEITDKAAIEFSRAFYETLVEGYPIEACMSEARLSINIAVHNTVEWGTPVLYTRSPDGILFTPVSKKPEKKPGPNEPKPGLVPKIIEKKDESSPLVSQVEKPVQPAPEKQIHHEPEVLPRKEPVRPVVSTPSFYKNPGPGRTFFKRPGFIIIIFIIAIVTTWLIINPGGISKDQDQPGVETVEKGNNQEKAKPSPTPVISKVDEEEGGKKTGDNKYPFYIDHQIIAKANKIYQNEKGYWEAELPDGIVMVYIPAGAFTMGSNSSEYDREKPEHTVYLDGYWIGKTEVTVGQYMKFVKEKGTNYPEWLEKGSKYNINTGTDGYYKKFGDSLQGDRYPVVGISWEDGVAYCNWLSNETGLRFNLPTEAQWEKAARGTGKLKYPWGEEFDKNKCNSDESGLKKTSPVGSYPGGASPYGVLDMAGNVWEWCSDWYDENYYKNSPGKNPTGPKEGDLRVIRGGSWNDDARFCRAAYRRGYHPANRWGLVGLRLQRALH